MGTRSSIVIYSSNIDDKEEKLAQLYVQFDGYLDGVGMDIYNILKNKKIVNGYSAEDTINGNFNGIGCLAASLIKHLKKDIGNVYLDSIKNDDYEYHNYHIYPGKNGKIMFKVCNPKEIFRDNINKFEKFLETYNVDEEDEDE